MRNILVVISVVFVFVQCEQYFVPDIETQSSSYVFEGMLTNIEGTHVIKISKSQSVDQDSMDILAGGFTVFIEGDDGTIFDTREKYLGMYYTRAFQKGTPGVSYRMKAISPGGKIYYSNWELLNAVAPIDSVNFSYGKKEILLFAEGIGYYGASMRGSNIVVTSKTQGFSPYNKYEYDLVFQNMQTYPTLPFPTTYHVGRPAFSVNYDYISVSNGNLYQNKTIEDHLVGFIPESDMTQEIVIPEVELDDEGLPIYPKSDIRYYQAGVLVKVKQYSLSEVGYNFWNAVRGQKEASGQIFDPVNSQVIGNIYCATDSTEQVFGYFGASGVVEKDAFTYLLSIKDEVRGKDIDYFPDLSRNMHSVTPPDFWVYY